MIVYSTLEHTEADFSRLKLLLRPQSLAWPTRNRSIAFVAAKKISYPHFLSLFSTFQTSLSPKNEEKKIRSFCLVDGGWWMSANTITLERKLGSTSGFHFSSSVF